MATRPAKRRSAGRGAWLVGIALVAVAWLALSLSRSVLLWDGAYVVFQALDRREPFTPHLRVSDVALQVLPLWLSRATDDVRLLAQAWGATYGAVPVLSLALAALVLRDRRVVWPALGIGFVLLPGQVFLVNQAQMVANAAWPLLATVAVGLPRRFLPVTVGVSAFLFLAHPVSAASFLMCAVAAVLVLPRQGRRRGATAVAVAAFLALAAGRLLVPLDPYEQDMATGGALLDAFRINLTPPMLLFFAVTVATVGYLLVRLLAGDGRWRRLDRAAVVGLPLAVVLAAVVMAWQWAVVPGYWLAIPDYRKINLVVLLPLFGGLVLAGMRTRHWWLSPVLERRLALAGCAAMAVGLGTQGLVVGGWLDHLQADLVTSPRSCVSVSSEFWMQRTPLNFWSLPYVAVLVQGREPARMVLSSADCDAVQAGQRAPIEHADSDQRWFRTAGFVAGLRGDSGQFGCTFVDGSGWHVEEVAGDSRYRWSSGRGEVVIRTPTPRDLTVSFEADTFPVPNRLAWALNGAALGDTAWVQPERRSFRATGLHVDAGDSTLTFTSTAPPARKPGGTRDLAFNVGRLVITDGSGVACPIG